jgi:hypothetical protein
MVEITLEYQRFHFFKFIKTVKGLFPSAVSELNQKQFIAIARLLMQTISDTDFLNIMTGIKKFRIKKLDDYYRYQLMLLFEPFTEVTPYNVFILPYIDASGTRYFSPNQKLARMNFARFIYAESYFVSYQTDKKPSDLHKFVASLYLPSGQKFDENSIPAAALAFSKVKPEILEAVVINYVLIKEWLSGIYPMVFQKEEEQDDNYELEKKSLKKPNNDSGWLKIFESVVGDDLVNHERYSELPLHNVLRWMSRKIVENIKRK